MNSFYVYANWKANEKIAMELNNYTENACTRNASKVHGKTLCWACVGSAGLNAYTEPPGFRQFISFSRKTIANLFSYLISWCFITTRQTRELPTTFKTARIELAVVMPI